MSRLTISAVLTLGASLSLPAWSTRAWAADNYGAIAFAQESGRIGYSYDYASRAVAEERALQECGADCEVVVWFMNACAALATGDDNGYGSGWAGNHREAERLALASCNENAQNCSVAQWVCTTR
jgi:serine/threonine-protein kinase